MGLEAENATLRQEKRELRTENAALKARIIELEEAVAALHGKGSQPPSFVKANKRKPKEKSPARNEHHRIIRVASGKHLLASKRIDWRNVLVVGMS